MFMTETARAPTDNIRGGAWVCGQIAPSKPGIVAEGAAYRVTADNYCDLFT